MKPVLRWCAENPTRVAAILTVLLGWAATAGVPDPVVGGAGTILAVFIGVPIYNAVAPIPHVIDTARAAALDAAKATAEQLSTQTAGGAGELTGAALGIATEAADDAATSALKTLGVPRRDRAR